MWVAARRGHELSRVLEQAPGHAMRDSTGRERAREVRVLATRHPGGHDGYAVRADGGTDRTVPAVCQNDQIWHTHCALAAHDPVDGAGYRGRAGIANISW